MKKKKLKVRPEVKNHLKKMYDILDAKSLSAEHLVKMTAGEGCGAVCMHTCSYYCRPTCTAQCTTYCSTACELYCSAAAAMACGARCVIYDAIWL